jgi:endo-1,4-beta-D-glucanase Y
MLATREAAMRAYSDWKTELVTDRGAAGFRRVRRPDSPYAQVDSTVSEGIAYGMILAVVHDDQALFDDLWKYSQHWANENGLMHWYIDAEGSKPLGEGGATDSDEDIAWALLHAERRWGGSGTIGETYAHAAKRQIEAVWRHEVDHSRDGLLMPGDKWTMPGFFNPSYFAPSQYRVFGKATGNVEGWGRVVETGYRVLSLCQNPSSGNASNGLVPAWCLDDGTPQIPFPYGPTHHQYDSARTPYRIAQDWLWHSEPRALGYCQKASAFFASLAETEFVDGFELDGSLRPDADSKSPTESAVFVGCAAVGASCDPAFAEITANWTRRVATGTLTTRSRYYNLSWTALTLAMLSGAMTEIVSAP